MTAQIAAPRLARLANCQRHCSQQPVVWQTAVTMCGTGFRNGHANGASATTYSTLANQHVDKLDRAQVSALAKQVTTGKLTWAEAQSRLDDWIAAATLPAFGVGDGNATPVNRPPTAVQQPQAVRLKDPLDELFQ